MIETPVTLARRVATQAIAESGRWRALRWAIGLVPQCRSAGDARDVALLLVATVLA